ncbi:Alpha/beta hydrolase-3 [Corchorus olitorius]|uniref:Alpha/beta hydrolase-3 n=1 Tax=Corchorus olitorius TaxID=93759 RepID=A0A1R3GYK0_9ROSI|nr:Alpha/beta hydrolase-3 [Corchorus olitorius]
MESTTSEIAMDFPPFLRIYKDGRIERILGTEIVPPGLDPKTNVDSKDVVFSQETGQYVRLYIPKNATSASAQKLPLLVYFHGGGFCIETASSPTYHNYLNLLVSEANIVAVSVDYRRAPEHPIPIAYDDSWDALKWVASHHGGNGPEEWLNHYADFDKVYFSGDSAGANIAHHMAVKTSKEKPDGINLAGIMLVHPYFWGEERVGDEGKNPAICAMIEGLWRMAAPTTSGVDDPWINPIDDQSQSLASLGCKRVLVCVADGDVLKDRGRYYVEKLKQSGWEGEAELMETQGEEHVFHLQKLTCENALAKLRKVVAFINYQDKA